MVHAFSQKHTGQISWEEIKYAVLRNFGGLASVNPVEIFQKRVDNTAQVIAKCFGSNDSYKKALECSFPILVIINRFLNIPIWQK